MWQFLLWMLPLEKTNVDEELIHIFKEKEIPYLVVYNKSDLLSENQKIMRFSGSESGTLAFSAQCGNRSGTSMTERKIASLAVTDDLKLRLVGDLLEPSDFAVLVVPIDKAAPKGRLILPQQQTIRDVLEAGAAAIVIKENELSNTLETLGKKPKLVITDSQVFAKVSKETPKDIWLTSFSILFARFKGNLKTAAAGAAAIDRLKDGDKILISEGCTHHRQCDDIGTVKLPRWIRNYTGKDLEFEYSSGRDFPEDVTKYNLIVHCGGCMLNEREMRYRQKCALDQEIPITNYGIAIAYMQGILKRCVEMFPDVRKELDV